MAFGLCSIDDSQSSRLLFRLHLTEKIEDLKWHQMGLKGMFRESNKPS